MICRRSPRLRQRGVALLLTLLVLFLAATYLFYRQANAGFNRSDRDARTAEALAKAREAIIAWSASHETTPNKTPPGMLPCPEDTSLIGTATEGKAQSSCSNNLPSIGRLPWRTLGIEPLTDADNEPLWYALSPGFRSEPINSNSKGQLLVDGQTTGAVAIVFAPGAALSGQNRSAVSAASPPDIAQYLDGTNADGNLSFTALPVSGTMNDLLLPIYPADLFRVVEKRVAQEVRYALLEYYCGSGNVTTNGTCSDTPLNGFFPRPASFSDTSCLTSTGNCIDAPIACPSDSSLGEGRLPRCPATGWETSSLLFNQSLWFHKNGWRELVYYAVAPACTDGTTDCSGNGYLSVQQPGSATQGNIKVVVIVTGPYLGTGSRSTTTLAHYLEEQNASLNDNLFTRWPTLAATPFNDRLITIP